MAISELKIGSIGNPTYDFTQVQILDVSGNLATSLSGSELSYDEMYITVNSPSVSIDYGTPAFYYSHDNLVAKMYVTSVVKVQQTQFMITIVSAIGLLDKMNHPGGLYTGQYLDVVINDLLSRTDQGDIPSGTYQEIEYLECTGTQYALINKFFNDAVRIETSVYFRDFASDQIVFGAFKSYNSYGFGVKTNARPITITSLSSSNDPVANNNYTQFNQIVSTNVKYDVSFNYRIATTGYGGFDHYTKFNGEEQYYRVSGSMSSSTPLSMCFGCAQKLTGSTMTTHYGYRGRIYTIRVYNDQGQLVSECVPVRRISDSVLGLYDTQDHTFHKNSGTGSFIAGPVVGGNSQYVIDFTVDPGIGNQPVYGWLPYDTKRNNLHKILFAYGLSALKDGNGDVYFTNIKNVSPTAILDEDVYNEGSIARASYASSVNVTEHIYTYDASVDLTELFNTNGLTVTNQLVRFSDAPINTSSLVASGLTVSESHVNYAIVSGNGTLSGKPYQHYTVLASKQNSLVTGERAINVTDDTLVSEINGPGLLDALFNFYTNGYTIKNSIVLTYQKCGNRYKFKDPFKSYASAYLASMAITGSNKVKAECEFIAGYSPKTVVPYSYEHYVILAGGGTWNVPQVAIDNGRMTVVLIGGGSGGQSGAAGSVGYNTGAQLYRWTDIESDPTAITTHGEGGEGGLGGTGGSGGKVLVVTLTTIQSSYSYSAGSSGNGGVRSSDHSTRNAGQAGGNTTFGSYSSANGSVIAGGYTNIFTGITYATSGVNGVRGGNGGSYEVVDGVLSFDGESVTFDGVTYTGGSAGVSRTDNYRNSAYGGCGGGAAVGNNGLDGDDCVFIVDYPNHNLHVGGGVGGAGVNGLDGDPGSLYGCGGNGGHGGGGAGAGGSAVYDNTQPWGGGGDAGAAGYRAGDGGAGGGGMSGCIIIYY